MEQAESFPLSIRHLRIDPSSEQQYDENGVLDAIYNSIKNSVDISVIGYANMIAVFITEFGKLGNMALVSLDNPLAITSAVTSSPETSFEYHENDVKDSVGGNERDSVTNLGPSVSVKPLLGSHGPSDLQTVHLSAYGQTIYGRILEQSSSERRPILLNCSLSTASAALKCDRDEAEFMRYIVDRIVTECRVW